MGTFYHSKSNLEEPEDILLEEPKASLNFSKLETINEAICL